MDQNRKNQLLILALVLSLVAAAVGLRMSPETTDWAPLFDIAALLSVVALSFGWERELAVSKSR